MDLQNRLKDYIKTKKRTISSVAKAVDVSTATLHLWMNNKYEGNIKKINDAVARFLEIEELREGRVSLDFVKTTVADDVFDIAKPATLKMKLAFVMVRPALERHLQLKDINMKTQELYLLKLI